MHTRADLKKRTQEEAHKIKKRSMHQVRADEGFAVDSRQLLNVPENSANKESEHPKLLNVARPELKSSVPRDASELKADQMAKQELQTLAPGVEKKDLEQNKGDSVAGNTHVQPDDGFATDSRQLLNVSENSANKDSEHPMQLNVARPELKFSAPGDTSKREAGQMAEQALQTPTPGVEKKDHEQNKGDSVARSTYAQPHVKRKDTSDATACKPKVSTDPNIYVVLPGDTLRHIAQKYNITIEALSAANPKPKLQEWRVQKTGKTVKGFNACEKIRIPVTSKQDSEEQNWSDWLIEKAKPIKDTVAGAVKGIENWWLRRLPEERIQYWVDIADQLYRDKKGAGKMPKELKNKRIRQSYKKKRELIKFKSDDIAALLPELEKDIKATKDPVQTRSLTAVKFQLETTKRGTIYWQEKDGGRDYNIEGNFDCSEAVQWMMREVGLGDIFGEATEKVATLYMISIIVNVFGGSFRKTDPRAGDLMLWNGHVGLVADVRHDEGVFLVSHMVPRGSSFNAYSLADLENKDKPSGGNSTKSRGAPVLKKSKLKGFWAPEDATLPIPIGTATIKKGGKAYKYFLPEEKSAYALDSFYEKGEQVNLLKKKGEMWLVQRVGTRGAAWVRAKDIKENPFYVSMGAPRLL